MHVPSFRLFTSVTLSLTLAMGHHHHDTIASPTVVPTHDEERDHREECRYSCGPRVHQHLQVRRKL
jgi:hypothetical protein